MAKMRVVQVPRPNGPLELVEREVPELAEENGKPDAERKWRFPSVWPFILFDFAGLKRGKRHMATPFDPVDLRFDPPSSPNSISTSAP
jgi:hypothetical protein